MYFPLGIIVDVCAVFVAGFVGGLVGSRLTERVVNALNILMGFVAMAIGIIFTIKVKQLAPVVLSLVLGLLLGLLLRLDDHICSLFGKVSKKIFKDETDEEKASKFNIVLVLSCCTGTGIFGALTEGLTGDSTILICKAIMDLTTMFIFATTIGKATSLACIPAAIVFTSLFFLAKLLAPTLNAENFQGNFYAVGGIIELIIAFNIIKVTKFKVIDALPALILVFPITYLWNLIF